MVHSREAFPPPDLLRNFNSFSTGSVEVVISWETGVVISPKNEVVISFDIYSAHRDTVKLLSA